MKRIITSLLMFIYLTTLLSFAQLNTIFNKYVTFSGTNRIEAEHLPLTSSTLPDAKLTLEVWMKTTQSTMGTIVGWKGASDGMMLRIFEGKLEWGEYINATWNKAVSTQTVNDGTWKHVVVVRDGGNVTMYIDGVEETVNLLSGTTLHVSPAMNSITTVIGAMSTTGSEAFMGSIDELRIWNTARTAEQITNNRNQSIDPATAGLLAYYTFNNESGINSAVNAPSLINITAVNTVFETGKFGFGARFSTPGNPYIPTANYKLPINGFTVESWIKCSDNTGSRTIVGFKNSAADYGIMLRVQDGKLQWGEWDGAWGNIMGTSIIPANESWTHVAVVRAPVGADSKLYINGIEETSINAATLKLRTTEVNTTSLTIGNIMPNSTENFRGTIDEVRIWNSARTSEQINESINNELTGTETGLLGLYHLESNGRNEIAVAAEYPKNVGNPSFDNHITTGNYKPEKNKINISVSNGIIRVTGTENFKIYSTTGQLQKPNHRLPQGIYIIHANEQAFKVYNY